MDRIVKKINLDQILDKFIDYIFHRNIFYHESIDGYYSGEEPSFWSKIKFYSRFLVLIIFVVKSGISTLFPRTLLWTPLTDATILFGKQSNLVNGLNFGLTLVTLGSKLVNVYYERQNNLKFLDVIGDLKARKEKYQLSQKHIKRLTSMTGLIYYGYIRITGSIVMFIIILFQSNITIATYLYCYYGNVIILLLWTIVLLISFNEIVIICLYGTFMFYLPITVLNYRFDELIDKLRISIRWNNTNAINRIIQSYNDLISDCKQLSGPYNAIIGLVYCLVPYVIAILVELMRINRNDLLFTFVKIIFIIYFIITNVNAFIINQISLARD